MAPTPTRAVFALSLLLASTVTLTSAQDSLGVVDPAFGTLDTSEGLFDYEYTSIEDEDALPSPWPADYEQEDPSEIFKRTVDGNEAAKRWHGHDLHKRALGAGWKGATTFRRAGTTGVGAMQVTVVDDDNIVICE
jgi:hypothetical protein